MRAFLAAAQHGRTGRLDRINLHCGFAAFQHFAHARQRAARAHAGHKDIHIAVRVAPNFFGSGLAVDFRVGRIVELARHEVGFGMVFHKFFGFGNRAVHAFGGRGEHQFRTVCAQQHFALFTHAFRHGDDQFVAFGRAHHCQADARVARSGFHNGGAGLDFAFAFCRFHHGQRNTVFHAAAGVEEFQFHSHARRQAAA